MTPAVCPRFLYRQGLFQKIFSTNLEASPARQAREHSVNLTLQSTRLKILPCSGGRSRDRDAIAALPNFSPLHKFLGICLLQTKHKAEAIRELSWYVNADPADAEGHYYLGSTLRAAGREEEAKAQFRLAPRKPR